MSKPISEQQRQSLLYKYAHVGCPACGYEDNCAHPSDCADNGRCLDLKPLFAEPGEGASTDGASSLYETSLNPSPSSKGGA